MLPKTIHIVWVGDQSKRPDGYITSWSEKNLGWSVKLWDNEALAEVTWLNEWHMRTFADAGKWEGVACLMRWEILLREGGIAVDADFHCEGPLNNLLLEHECFACWENDLTRPLIDTRVVGARPGNWFLRQLVLDIQRNALVAGSARQSVGAKRLTEAYHKYNYTELTILPYHLFRHPADTKILQPRVTKRRVAATNQSDTAWAITALPNV